MSRIPLYPLRFEPIYQYRLWGGRRLAELLAAPLPRDGPIGEAWLLSDRDDHASRVANGPLNGATIRQLLEQSPEPMLGKSAGRFQRFPLLLKFLDARDVLSVQVHPADGRTDLLPPGESGKTEAWVVLEQSQRVPRGGGTRPLQKSMRDILPTGRTREREDILIVFGNQAAIYAIRERRRLWSSRPSFWVVVSSVADILIASTLATLGIFMTPLPIFVVAGTLAATVVFAFVVDAAKRPVFERLGIS